MLSSLFCCFRFFRSLICLSFLLILSSTVGVSSNSVLNCSNFCRAIFPGILVILTPVLLMWQKIALSLPFGDDGSWSGKVTIGMGVVAFTSATPSGLTAAAYYAVYDNLVLCK